jgi:hypothetical protein
MIWFCNLSCIQGLNLVDRFVNRGKLGEDYVRVKYDLLLRFEDIDINEVIIDQHYTEKHFDVSDWIILELVKHLNHREVDIKSKTNNDLYSYFVAEPLFHNNKPYRLVFLIEAGQNYIGVINAFRIKEKK